MQPGFFVRRFQRNLILRLLTLPVWDAIHREAFSTG